MALDLKSRIKSSDSRIKALPSLPIFNVRSDELSLDDQVQLSLQRAEAIQEAYSLTETDIKTLSPAFWNMNVDPIVCLDPAATTLLTIQLNLAAGSLAAHVDDQPHHRLVLRKMLRFEVSGQFCLTELDHGLDAISIETTATHQSDGSFILHTPHSGAAKFMPPTSPCGKPCYAVVFARLIHEGSDRGIRGFVVQLTDGQQMNSGVAARILPPRGGTHYVRHCLTTFDNVRLPGTAILGTLEGMGNPRLDFFQSIWRVAVGSLALGTCAIPCTQVAAYVAGRYSQRRMVNSGGKLIPIISFKTQHGPILTALAQSFVLKEFWRSAVELFTNDMEDPRVRHAIAAIFKVTAVDHSQTAHFGLSERCGAQGLFNFNQMAALYVSMRGIAIAEGDLLGISIRLASELILERYEIPQPTYPDGLLARHEIGLISHFKQLLDTLGDHRSEAFSRALLPRAEKIIRSIGHRMAYDAAVAAGLDRRITDLYLWTAVRMDEVWYSEHAGLTAEEQFTREDAAISAALPLLDSWLDAPGIEPYIRAPIVSEDKWKDFADSLPVKRHTDVLSEDMIRAHL